MGKVKVTRNLSKNSQLKQLRLVDATHLLSMIHTEMDSASNGVMDIITLSMMANMLYSMEATLKRMKKKKLLVIVEICSQGIVSICVFMFLLPIINSMMSPN